MTQSHDVQDQTRAPRILVAQISLIVLAAAAVFLFAVCKRFAKIPWEYDDYLIIAALVFFGGDSVSIFVGISFGYGKHLVVLTPDQVRGQLKMLYIQPLFYSFTTTCIRLAILLFYLRLFSPVRRLREACYVVIFLVMCNGIGSIFIAVFQCSPIRYSWDKSIEGHCLDQQKNYMVGPVTSFFLDLVIMILPLSTFLNLRMRSARKCYIIAIFSIGSLTCFSAIVREPYVLHHRFSDFSWDHTEVGIWASTEESLGIFCACLPSFRIIYLKPSNGLGFRKRNISLAVVDQSSHPTRGGNEANIESQNTTEGIGRQSNDSAARQEIIPTHQASSAFSVEEGIVGAAS